jgi:signal transduction histidine kinase
LYSEEKERKELIIETKGIVDQAINDIRNISRNIMPESFSEHGLLQTLLSFIERIKVSKVLNIEFKHNLIGISYNKAFEIIVYRIITELINNTLKHANANNVIIKVFENDNVLNIFYKDDGRGFNVNSVVNSDKSGLGLKNILERVKSLGGEINISSNWKIGIIVEILLNVK